MCPGIGTVLLKIVYTVTFFSTSRSRSLKGILLHLVYLTLFLCMFLSCQTITCFKLRLLTRSAELCCQLFLAASLPHLSMKCVSC